MTDKTVPKWESSDPNSSFSQGFADVGGGMYGPYMAISADLRIGAKSLEITLDGDGKGSFPIPDGAHLVGVRPEASTSLRVGLEAPEANGAATGAALAANLAAGVPCDDATWTWFAIAPGQARTFHLKGIAGKKTQCAAL